MIKYVNFGHHNKGIHMYVITMFKTEYGNYKVEVIPCDIFGNAVSEATEWDLFTSWWQAIRYVRNEHKKFYNKINSVH